MSETEELLHEVAGLQQRLAQAEALIVSLNTQRSDATILYANTKAELEQRLPQARESVHKVSIPKLKLLAELESVKANYDESLHSYGELESILEAKKQDNAELQAELESLKAEAALNAERLAQVWRISHTRRGKAWKYVTGIAVQAIVPRTSNTDGA